MATTKLYLDMRGLPDTKPGPLKIVIRHRNSAVSIPLNIRLLPSEWDGSGVVRRKDSAALNVAIRKQVADVESQLLLLTMSRDVQSMTADELKSTVIENLYPDRAEARRLEQKRKLLFVPLYEAYVGTKRSEGTKALYLRTLDRMRANDKDLDTRYIGDIDHGYIVSLDAFLSKTNTKNSRSILLRNLKSFMNHERAEGLVVEDPFKQIDLREEKTVKRSMDVETLRRIRDAVLDDWQVEYRDMFMLMFYLIGINFIDLFSAKKSQLVGGRLEYDRRKTGKHYSVKVQPEAMEIIKRYEGKNYLLSPLDRYANPKDYLQHMNRALSKLGLHYTTSSKKTGEAIFPGLSTYWSRHTWATLAYQLGVPVDIIGQALGHSDRSHAVTFVYIRLDDRKVDQANRMLIDFVNSSKAVDFMSYYENCQVMELFRLANIAV